MQTQQKLIVIGFSTLCGAVLLSLVTLSIEAILHDGATLAVVQQVLQWGLIGISGILGIHTYVSGGIMASAPRVAPPATPEPAPVPDTPALP